MVRRRFRLLFLGIAVVSMLLTAYFSNLEKQESDFFEASVHGVLQKVADAGDPGDPSLSIDNVVFEKISDPYRDSSHYRYQATVFIENTGRKFRNLDVSLSADNNREVLPLKNSSEGFSLDRDESYIVEDYEILFDANYNGGTVTLSIEDYDSYELDFFELPAKIESVGVGNVTEDGEISIRFRPSNLFLSTDDHEIYVTDSLNLRGKDLHYRELLLREKIYGYHVVKADEALVKHDGWEKVDSVKLHDNPFELESNYFVYIKAVNPETGHYGFSDILVLGPQREFTRAEFAKFLVNEADIEIFDEGSIFFEDVKPEDEFSPYVQTLFNLGLVDYTDELFLPEGKITREEALVTVMDYFDVDLAVNPDKSRFNDIESGSFIYHYTQALFYEGKAGAFGNYFMSDFPATKNYLTHIIHAYK